MQLPIILLLAGLAIVLRLAPLPVRRWLVFAASVVCLFWLQPALPIRALSFWLPTATLALAVTGWLLTTSGSRKSSGEKMFPPDHRADALAAGLLFLLILVIGLSRYLGQGDWLLAALPPPAGSLLTGLALAALALFALYWFSRRSAAPGWLLGLSIALVILFLVILKTPWLALQSAQVLRLLNGQNAALAAALDVRWLGFSYIAFRLIHVLRDRQTGRLVEAGLRDTLSYVIFFPALVAGPIDRLERFTKDFCPSLPLPEEGGVVLPNPHWLGTARDPQFAADFSEAGRRLTVGLVKKFVLADTLALVALNPTNALQVHQAGWMWLLLYVYAFQIFLDFSGYSDIAIGIGRIIGVRLPENFAAPYLKPNLTKFWNSWHMSLTQWFRAYFFNPFVRWLRTRRVRVAAVWVLLFSQVATMLLIGLWHGVTLNFVLWGLWHGAGMFVQNRWSEATRGWFAARSFSPFLQRIMNGVSTLLTFHFIALGWVFFLLPTPGLAVTVFKTLFHL
jgi:alginate O-acetyltransferase complex protein AlgI